MAGWTSEQSLTTDGAVLPPLREVQRELLGKLEAEDFKVILRSAERSVRSSFLKRIDEPHQKAPGAVACGRIVSKVPGLNESEIGHLVYCVLGRVKAKFARANDMSTDDNYELLEDHCVDIAGQSHPSEVPLLLTHILDASQEDDAEVNEWEGFDRRAFRLLVASELPCPEQLLPFKERVSAEAPSADLDLRSAMQNLKAFISEAAGNVDEGRFPGPQSFREQADVLERVWELAHNLGVDSDLASMESAIKDSVVSDELSSAVDVLRGCRGSDDMGDELCGRLHDNLLDPGPYSEAIIALAALVEAVADKSSPERKRELHDIWLSSEPCPVDHDSALLTAIEWGRVLVGVGRELPMPEEPGDGDPDVGVAEPHEELDSAIDTATQATEPLAIGHPNQGLAENPQDQVDNRHSGDSATDDDRVEPPTPEVGDLVAEAPSTLADASTPEITSDAIDLAARALARHRFGVARQLLIEEEQIELATAVEMFLSGEYLRSVYPRSGSTTLLPRLGSLLKDGAGNALTRVSPIAAAAVATRLVLLTGYSCGATEWASAIIPALSSKPNLESVLQASLSAAQGGFQLPASGVSAPDGDNVGKDLTELRNRCAEAVMNEPKRKLKFRAATALYHRWCQPEGLLGRALQAVGDQSDGWAVQAEQVIGMLHDRSGITDQIKIDHAANGRRGRRTGKDSQIHSSAREQLIDHVVELRDLLVEAVELEKLRKVATAGESQTQRRIMELRDAYPADASEYEPREFPNGPLGEALDQLGHESLRITHQWVVNGVALPPPDVQTGSIDLDMAFDSSLAFSISDDGFDLVGAETARLDRVSLEELLGCDNPVDWSERSARIRIDLGDQTVVDALFGTAFNEHEELLDELTRLSRQQFESLTNELRVAMADVERRLNRNRMSGQVSEEDWPELSGVLERAKEDLFDERLRGCREALDHLEKRLDVAQHDASERLRKRFDGLIGQIDVDPDDRRLVEQCLQAGHLATAEEYLAMLLQGHRLPQVDVGGESLAVFFPEMNDELVEYGRLDGRTATTAGKGEIWGPLHFDSLTGAERKIAEEGLTAWAGLRGEIVDAEMLRPILSVVGIEGTIEPSAGGGRDRQVFQVVKVRRNGKAMVPEFGSRSGGNSESSSLRVLLITADVAVDLLFQWAKDDEGGTPLLVLYSGGLSSHDRRRLISSEAVSRPFVVIDDTLFAYLASASGRSFERTMRLTLPFARLNPYRAGVAGQVAEEMFYGRRAELDELMNLEGSSFVFGGRQLGKSALLVEAGRRFRRSRHCESAYLDLKGLGVGVMGGRPPAHVWDLLWKRLHKLGVVKAAPKRVSREVFRDALNEWLEAVPDRRLLLLLDECDAFLEADAEAGFGTVAQLKELMESSGRRVKIVIAGLHRVHRYDRVENHPLEHLGRNIPVGPLSPQAANDLISQPTSAMGYRFESDELVARIQALTNNQPKQIVQFMSDLLDRVRNRRASVTAPPRVITRRDVDLTYDSPELAEELRRTFDLTIRMDNAYRVIAYTMALLARQEGADLVVPEWQLRDEATSFWPEGLDDLGRDAFRSLCDELVVLSVLAPTPGPGYRLRTPNLLRLLGTEDQIFEALVDASEEVREQRYDARQHRRMLSSGTLSPLAQDQRAELLAPESRVRLVIGTSASGSGYVSAALADETALPPDTRVYVAAIGSNQATRRFNAQNRSGHTVVVLEIGDASMDRVDDVLRRAAEAVSADRTDTIGIVVVADERHVDLWHRALNRGLPEEVGVVELRPVSDEVLRHSDGVVDLALASTSARESVLKVTGGQWVSVDRIVQVRRSGQSLADALATVEACRNEDVAPCLAVLDGSMPLRRAFDEVADLLGADGRLPVVDLEEIATTIELDLLRVAGGLSSSVDGIGLSAHMANLAAKGS